MSNIVKLWRVDLALDSCPGDGFSARRKICFSLVRRIFSLYDGQDLLSLLYFSASAQVTLV